MKNLMVIFILISAFNFEVSAQHITKKQFLKMNDQELWEAGIAGKIGSCSISDARNCEKCFCDFYVKTNKEGLEGPGLPHGYGSGCVVAPQAPKGINNCWGSPNVYQDYNLSKTPICTKDHIKNAANMIRIALKRSGDLCNLKLKKTK
jgi:hypothetical protein